MMSTSPLVANSPVYLSPWTLGESTFDGDQNGNTCRDVETGSPAVLLCSISPINHLSSTSSGSACAHSFTQFHNYSTYCCSIYGTRISKYQFVIAAVHETPSPIGAPAPKVATPVDRALEGGKDAAKFPILAIPEKV